ncbi:MAG TPA: N-6 DNA methylase [Phycisphaerae bacterium]|nr:N-6 DNA methylase [Phycisphaerae bacterium]
MLIDPGVLSRAWSAHVRHSLLLDTSAHRAYVRRWDYPGVMREFPTPDRGADAARIFEAMEGSQAPRSPDVIQHVLRLFRMLRQAFRGPGGLWPVRVMNGLLLLADRRCEGRIEERELRSCRRVGEALAMLPGSERRIAEVEDQDLPADIKGQELGVLIDALLAPEPHSGCVLDPDVLLRHASSKLYQEAHLDIERDPQLSFAGMGSVEEPSGRSPSDVRFTPPNLARALTEQAIGALGELPENLIVIDPACGSGVFLRECIRELTRLGYTGTLKAVGYDISEISVCMTRFCLSHARRDLPPGSLRLRTDVVNDDSLLREWGPADVVLMNPPFISLEALPPGKAAVASNVLGELAGGRIDYAMAFVLKAVESLKPGGILASVLPASLLSGDSARPLRERLSDIGRLRLIGRFEGYRYFPTSVVETAFVVFQKAKAHPDGGRCGITVIVGEEGSEDAALRCLRMPPDAVSAEPSRVDRYELRRSDLPSANWRPVRRRQHEFRELLRRLGLPTVGRLFDVRQGTRLGAKALLLRPAHEVRALRPSERRFFKPAAGRGSIVQGQLTKQLYVFFPYDENGLMIRTEEQLMEQVPAFYRGVLEPNKDKLIHRASRRKREWWEPSEPRNWQYSPSPQIVSAYFGGGSGSFAYDSRGEYVTVNGHAWVWRGFPDVDGVDALTFHSSRLPWAYLALLNSTVFERILLCFAARLQGGQMRLEQRFVKAIPIPYLGDEARTDSAVLQGLVEGGRRIHKGDLEGVRDEIDEGAGLAYGIPRDLWAPF